MQTNSKTKIAEPVFCDVSGTQILPGPDDFNPTGYVFTDREISVLRKILDRFGSPLEPLVPLSSFSMGEQLDIKNLQRKFKVW